MAIRADYWQHKVSIWLHDPVHKALKIQGHEERAAEIARMLNQSAPDKNEYTDADQIASGLSRAALPGYSADAHANGAIDFSVLPVLTHPLVAGSMKAQIAGVDIDKVQRDILALLAEDIGTESFDTLNSVAHEERPLSGFFNQQHSHEEWSKALFFYLFFAFKKRLRQKNIGGLGGLWDMLPADSRMPDHPVWHHLGLTSALGSVMADDKSSDAALAVFSITPVQAFISKARKLRDQWMGSVILSYLAFTGIKYIADTIGPDHIVYPSMHDQPLVEQWLSGTFHLGRFLKETDSGIKKHSDAGSSIAAFPNKFVFLCSLSRTKELCKGAEAAIQAEWLRTARCVKEFLADATGSRTAMQELFEHQIADYWQFSYAASKLAGIDDSAALADVLAKSTWTAEEKTVAAFSKPFGGRNARLYGATHSLAQGVLAAAKMKPGRIRAPQAGEKCPLCGEHEVLHALDGAGTFSAHEHTKAYKTFWDTMRAKVNAENSHAELGKNERLCAVCAVKRFLPRALQRSKNELLATVVRDADKFPSTTEMASQRYLSRLRAQVTLTDVVSAKLIDHLHSAEVDDAGDDDSAEIQTVVAEGKKHGIPFRNKDKYYAMLVMDGDRMGDLVNGRTLTALWGDVLHPELKKRFSDPGFKPNRDVLRSMLKEKRTLNPALHAATTDALNSFARFAAAPIITKAGGRLIYAGGDDICAIMPLDGAVDAADTIRQAYTMGFVEYTADGVSEIHGTTSVSGKKIGMHLGKADAISLSAALVIAHHKEPLREVVRDAHAVLDTIAKKKAGRNALAIRLKKRSGGDRDFYCSWDEKNPFNNESILASFRAVMRTGSDDISTSLIYRLEQLRGALRPLMHNPGANKDKIRRLFEYEVKHSGLATVKDAPVYAEQLAGICLPCKNGVFRPVDSNNEDWFIPEAAVIARFLFALPEVDA